MRYYKTHTLGCKVNTYETQAIKELLNKNGYVESGDDCPLCDVYIINTCAVTAVGEQKSRQKIRSAIKMYPGSVIVVMGCYAQLHAQTIQEIEGTSIVIGTQDRKRIVELLDEYFVNKEQINIVEKNTRQRTYECLDISDYQENTRAFLKIQDGCNNFCSYCIIPYTRGNFRSRPKEDVLKEVRRLVDNGFKEIVLTGIDTSSYGKDLQNYSFDDLLKDIIQIAPELKRLRISSIEESCLSDEFISLLQNSPIIAHHLHLPLQSGSKTVLERMKRKYTKEEFYQTVKKIKDAVPDMALACDVIVGFPGESEEEFNETCEFIKKCEFAYLHVFPYSKRPGTPAAMMKDQVEPKIKKERTAKLIALGEELKKKYELQYEGKEVDVLVETFDEKKKMYKGYSSSYLEVYVESSIDICGQYIRTTYHRYEDE
ncbi:MAG: tRNA (N(6)-L-threonylcarbamoyladenosine(37)-C(2))-methylthiotransferase MtaB [Bacilli bacterium]